MFCARRGKCYLQEDNTSTSFHSLWQRYMRALVKAKKIARFTERDLRAKCATDAESLEHAQKLLAHANSATTKRIYRRKPERVQPLR